MQLLQYSSDEWRFSTGLCKRSSPKPGYWLLNTEQSRMCFLGGCNIFGCCSHLLLRRRSELFGFLGSEGCRHVERQHDLIVAQSLVVLEAGHEVVREGNQCFNAMAQLTVTQVLQYVAYLHNLSRDWLVIDFDHKLGRKAKSILRTTCISLSSSSNYTKILA